MSSFHCEKAVENSSKDATLWNTSIQMSGIHIIMCTCNKEVGFHSVIWPKIYLACVAGSMFSTKQC